MIKSPGAIFSGLLACVLFVGLSQAQTTEFTFQGSLKDSAAPANGTYDLEFALFDTASGGNQIGPTIDRSAVSVTNGIFSSKLDFGNQFPGADRFLEVRVRVSGQPTYVTLLPRQTVNSSPYAIKSVNADNATSAASATTAQSATTATNSLQLGGVAAEQYVLTGDARLSDPRNPLAGSPNYIQNSIAQQSASNFNVTGSGSANIFNAATQYNLSGSRILSAPGTFNLFAGVSAGALNTTGQSNSFFGYFAGAANTSGFLNSFFGGAAGNANTTGGYNSFFGFAAGNVNTQGSQGSFFGESAGVSNTTGVLNTFVGQGAGSENTTGGYNSSLGDSAGESNRTGSYNTAIGTFSDVGSEDLTYATAIGAQAVVSSSNTIALGRASGADTVQIPGTLIVNTIVPSSNIILIGHTTGVDTVRTPGILNVDSTDKNTGTVRSNALVFGVNSGEGIASKRTSGGNQFDLELYTEFAPRLTISQTGTVTIPGNLNVTGSIAKGSGSFKIDDPLDPANKYLYHSFVESPDMMNIYNGNVTTDANGDASITLPAYFEALNRDFRYQLTVIGQFAQAIVLEEIKGNAFKIKTDKPNVKVSWQVTGIRHDKYADDERIKVEENKPAAERGKCLYQPACKEKR